MRQPVQLLVDQVTLYCEILYDVHSLLITCHQFFLSKIYVLIFFLFSSYQFNVIYVHLFYVSVLCLSFLQFLWIYDFDVHASCFSIISMVTQGCEWFL